MLTGALGDPLTRIIVLFAEQILKKNYPNWICTPDHQGRHEGYPALSGTNGAPW